MHLRGSGVSLGRSKPLAGLRGFAITRLKLDVVDGLVQRAFGFSGHEDGDHQDWASAVGGWNRNERDIVTVAAIEGIGSVLWFREQPKSRLRQ